MNDKTRVQNWEDPEKRTTLHPPKDSILPQQSHMTLSSKSEKQFILSDLPFIAATIILSYFPWFDKVNIVEAVPEWQKHLKSPNAWPIFQPDTQNFAGDMKQFNRLLSCVHKYGFFFQVCNINMPLVPCTRDVQFLQAMTVMCSNIKVLRYSFTKNYNYSAYQDIFKLLCDISKNCSKLKHFSILNVNCSHNNENIIQNITTYGLDTILTELSLDMMLDSPHALTTLYNFSSLKKLQINIHYLNTDILLYLAKQSLHYLIVVNDSMTLDTDFKEGSSIEWNKIAEINPKFSVHYIIKETTYRKADVVPNPLVKGLIFDSLCTQVNEGLLEEICQQYGNTLQIFGHFGTQWDYTSYEEYSSLPDMYSNFFTRCKKLDTFAFDLKIQSQTIKNIASDKMKCLWISDKMVDYSEDGLQSLQLKHAHYGSTCREWLKNSLEKQISATLGREWRLLDKDEMKDIFDSLTRL